MLKIIVIISYLYNIFHFNNQFKSFIFTVTENDIIIKTLKSLIYKIFVCTVYLYVDIFSYFIYFYFSFFFNIFL